MNGFLLIDKPQGMSSFGVVSRVRKLLKIRKAGHCGTLDPLATGLLIICLGKATKLSRFVLGNRKSYSADILLGATTSTYDREGELVRGDGTLVPTLDEVEAALRKFTGKIEQTPPIYSALKVKGKPLYKYARADADVEIQSREVLIESIALTEYDYPHLAIQVTCGSGTYIRSLAHDIGQFLGVGGYIDRLRRVSIGDVVVDSALSLADFEKIVTNEGGAPELAGALGSAFVGIEEMIDLPEIRVAGSSSAQVENGVPLRYGDLGELDRTLPANQYVALKTDSGSLLAIGRTLFGAEEFPNHADERVIEYVRVL